MKKKKIIKNKLKLKMGICGESSRKKNVNEKSNNNSNNNKEPNLVNNQNILHSSTEIKGNQTINKKNFISK